MIKIPLYDLVSLIRRLEPPSKARGRVIWDFVPEGLVGPPRRIVFEVEETEGGKRWVMFV